MLLLLACTTPEPAAEKAPTPILLTPTSSGLTAATEAAISLAPDWIQGDLRLALKTQTPERQEILITALDSPADPELIDEIAFSMAHLSPETLASEYFYPELLIENAKLIYEVDAVLDYVELVELGDGRTTTRYQVEVDGQLQTIELDSELYYWFIVHPRIEDEHPWYIEPWSVCGKQTLECPSNPEEGTFWRRYLWDGALESCPDGEVCPILSDYLLGTQVLYGDAEGLDAVHLVASMLLDSPGESRWFSFGAYGERSIQPVRIYGLGRGNCGEWADMTSALSRIALIPNVNITPSSWDHTWNAFYLEEWKAWEPVNWAFDVDYGSGYATWATRGDTSIWYQSERYTGTVATLEVKVQDASGAPMDGAIVALWSPYEDSFWYAGELLTDSTGTARFTIGADKEFAFFVGTEFGDFPTDGYLDYATHGIPAGTVETKTVSIDGYRATIPAPLEAAVETVEAAITLNLELEGRLQGPSYRMEESSSQPHPAPELTSWLMTQSNYELFMAGQTFEVLDFSAGISLKEPLMLVLGNNQSEAIAATGNLELTVSPMLSSRSASTLTMPVTMLPGEFMAIQIQ
jgi:hypothetical protein